MDHHQMARMIAAGRIVVGGLLVVAPGLPGRRWLGPGGATREAKIMTRAMGARDVALAVGTLRAMSSGENAQPWVLGAAASDAADALATVIGLGRRQPGRALVVGAMTTAVALAGARAGRELAEV